MSRDDLVVTPTHVRFLGRRFPRTIGNGGVRGDKREGDGATPGGTHRIIGMLYRPDRIKRPTDWARPIRVGDLWSDASGQEDYNLPVRAPYVHSHEKLRRSDPMYDLILITDWNYPRAKPDNGSAIFVHQWRGAGKPTAGCVAFRRDHLWWISQRIRPNSRLVIV